MSARSESEGARVTVEVEGQPSGPPPESPLPPDLAETGLSLMVLLVMAAAFTATGLLLRRLADRLTRGDV